MLGYIAFAAVLMIALAAWLSRKRHMRPHSVAEASGPKITISPTLGRFLEALNSENSIDAPNYVKSLSLLKSESKSVIDEADRLLVELPEELFMLRHSIVLSVAALRNPDALDFLSKVALNPQPLPPKERPNGAGAESPELERAIQGTLISLDAIDGIEALALDGQSAAIEVLVRAAQVESNTIRAAAITALGARAEWTQYHQRALSALPLELDHLGKLHRADVSRITQIRDPRAHLAGSERQSPPAPSLPEDQGSESTRRTFETRGAPQIGRR
ncbi:hypothetical protein [Rhizobium sp. ICMP 5592]|uniref:hypothetical protein n=1 Tax=Rhizobium sp. ICMP 5592 TaxID=2292445 RepID=UPI001297EACA|nr:hypothetical protein [Rhizobium sp. ICMP 5592]